MTREEADMHMISDFNDFRPLLDAVDRLRKLKVTDEGISLPTIVVVGDQSNGKSSVLESLAKVDLPRGEGVVTRVPLILELQDSTLSGDPEVTIEYGNQSKAIDESEISSSIQEATLMLAGSKKNILDMPISLRIRKPGAPDLTMVDLPGITRVPIDGQPEDILEQIKNMIMKYISPEASIILNVVQASVDFSTCESIRLSRLVDKYGQRTLVVVTKVDKTPENLFDKVTSAAANIGLGYICVRNRTQLEGSYEEARAKEAEIFSTHNELRKFPKDMAGIPSLTKQLIEIQAGSLRKSMPKLVRKIDEDLMRKKNELKMLPVRAVDEATASSTYLHLSRRLRASMEKLLKGDFTEFVVSNEMHFSARSYELFNNFSKQLDSERLNSDESTIEQLLKEAKGVSLPNFLEYSVFQHLIAQEVNRVSTPCLKLVVESHEYATHVAFAVIDLHTEGYPRLRAHFKRKMQEVLSRSREDCDAFVQRKLAKESKIVFTYNSGYMELRAKIENKQQENEKISDAAIRVMSTYWKVAQSREIKKTSDAAVRDMSTSLKAYWKVVQSRLTDEIPLEVRFALQEALIEEWESEVCQSCPLKMFDLLSEDPQLHFKRTRLLQSIETLEKSHSILQEFGSL